MTRRAVTSDDHEEATAVQTGLELAGVEEQSTSSATSDDDAHARRARAARPCPYCSREPPRCPHERERGTDQQRRRAGVGAVVDARRIGVRHVEHRHQHASTATAAAEDRQQQAVPLGAPELEPAREEQRPQEVELLLDRERPQVLEQRGPARRSRSTTGAGRSGTSSRRRRSPRRLRLAASRRRPAGTSSV